MKTFAIKTLGCKVNTYESEIIKSSFLVNDYLQVPFSEIADVYIINTCTVTNTADSKSRKAIRKANKQNKAAIICAVGCYTQLNPDEAASIEGVDIVLGSKYKNDLVNMVIDYKINKIRVDEILQDKEFEKMELETYTERTRAFIKIQDGCNKFCTYCLIPLARGNMRSKDNKAILSEVNKLVSNGFLEIVLTGIHTGGYGEDLKNYSLFDLLQDLNKIEGLKRIRLSSIEINQLSNEIIDLMKNSDKFLNHLHIPIQSGSNATLRAMKRQYNLKQYEDKINYLRKEIKDLNISTDLIVGFPEETEQQHEETLNTLNKLKFSSVHVFPYSKRNQTPASKLKQLNGTIIEKRAKEVIDLSKKIELEYNQSFLNKELDVLFEKSYNDELIGHTNNYLKIAVRANKNLINKIKKVKIISVNNNEIKGEL